MEMPLLKDIVIILGSSVLIILIFQRIKIPSILGFLITGILVGPYGLSLIKASHEVELMAEIGIIFLLFVIGIEFSLKSLASIKKTVFVGGMLQVGGTILVTSGIIFMAGLSWPQAIFIGFLLVSIKDLSEIQSRRSHRTAPRRCHFVAIDGMFG